MTTNSSALPKTFSANLSEYFREANKYPLIEQDRETALAIRWQEDQGRTAIAELINCHLGYVVKIATDFKGFGMPFEELIAADNLGLVKAASRFDPEKSVRLSAYAKF
jgi:RNA polymerase sigma-32 factor